jgi:hypothetical protein
VIVAIAVPGPLRVRLVVSVVLSFVLECLVPIVPMLIAHGAYDSVDDLPRAWRGPSDVAIRVVDRMSWVVNSRVVNSRVLSSRIVHSGVVHPRIVHSLRRRLITPDDTSIAGHGRDGRRAIGRPRLVTRRKTVDPDAAHTRRRALARRNPAVSASAALCAGGQSRSECRERGERHHPSHSLHSPPFGLTEYERAHPMPSPMLLPPAPSSPGYYSAA